MQSTQRRAPSLHLSPDEEAEEELELDLDDPVIDEAELPPLDMDDAEALAEENGYSDLLDQGRLEHGGEEDLDDDRSIEDIGLTIELNDAGTDEDAQVVDLDVGSLLTPLPTEGTELELDLGQDGAVGVAALREVLLPGEEDEEEHDDREVGDDDRFPAFDEASDIEPRPSLDDDEPEEPSTPDAERSRN